MRDNTREKALKIEVKGRKTISTNCLKNKNCMLKMKPKNSVKQLLKMALKTK